MKIKVKRLHEIVNHMRYDSSSADQDVEIEVIEADPGNGIMVDCLKLTVNGVSPATQYSPEKQISQTVEVFNDAGIKPRIVKTESFDMKE